MPKTLMLEANQRLKSSKIGIMLELRENKICSRGMLSPKPGSDVITVIGLGITIQALFQIGSQATA